MQSIGVGLTATQIMAIRVYDNPEDEFMNMQFRWGFWAQSQEFSDFRYPYTMFTFQTSFKTLVLWGGGGGGGGGNKFSRGNCENQKLKIFSQ